MAMVRLFAAASSEAPHLQWKLSVPLVLLAVVLLALSCRAAVRSNESRGRGFAALVFLVVVGLICAKWLLQPLSVQQVGNQSNIEIQNTAYAPRESLREFEVTPDSDFRRSGLSTADTATHSETADDDETVWLPVGRENLARLFGEENIDDIASLSEELSKHSETAYALIPVSEAQPAPVIRHVLTPTPFRELLTPQNLQLLASALDGYTSQDGDSATSLAEAESPELASWVSQRPGLGQVVVKTDKFHESDIPPEEALRPAIIQALEERITELASHEFSIGRDWNKLVKVSLSDRALRECILRTDRRLSEIETVVEGKTVMQQTYALIQFPEEAESHVVSVIRGRLTESRTLAVGLTLGALWLAAVLLAVACRISQSGSWLKRWTTGPLFAVAAVPCLIAFVLMIVAMAEGHTFELRLGEGRMQCIVDSSE